MDTIIDVYALAPVPNVCDQILREVIALPDVSLAHVIMDAGNRSLLHQHQHMTEIYYILSGEGILCKGTDALLVQKNSPVLIPSNTPHQLHNTGSSTLEHLVFAIPPFIPEDIEVMDGKETIYTVKKTSAPTPLIPATDGAMIREIPTGMDIGLAAGYLPIGRKALPHYHAISEEVYYIISGSGILHLDRQRHPVSPGITARIPRNTIHALENTGTQEMEILCLSTPKYTEEDFIRV